MSGRRGSTTASGSRTARDNRGKQPANERMQLTWLIGAPSRPASVHRLVVGRRGFGSPATQLMRAVRQHLEGKVMTLHIQTAIPDLELVMLAEDDAQSVYDLLQHNRSHLTHYGNFGDILALSVADLALGFRNRLPQELRMGVYISGQLVGQVDLNAPALGIYVLGYWIDATHTGGGFAKSSCAAAIDHVRREFGAHEVWAGVRSSNSASVAVIEHLGFELVESLPTHQRYRLQLA